MHPSLVIPDPLQWASATADIVWSFRWWIVAASVLLGSVSWLDHTQAPGRAPERGSRSAPGPLALINQPRSFSVPIPRDPDYLPPGTPPLPTEPLGTDQGSVVEFPLRAPADDVLPPVQVGHDPRAERVVMWLDYDHARALAQLLGSTLAVSDGTGDQHGQRFQWAHTAVDLRSAVALANVVARPPAVVRRLPNLRQ